MSPLLEVEGLTKRFGGLVAVNKLTFSLDAGEIVGLIGPNGAGKTTALNLISGTYRPGAGKVRFKGTDITGWRTYRVARLGLVRTFQSTVSYRNSSVFENIFRGFHFRESAGLWASFWCTKSARCKDERATEQMHQLLHFLGMEEWAYRAAGSLPYGYQKLLGIGIALAAGPELLMLDEPAAGMIPEESTRLVELLRRINQRGISILLVEHDMRVVMGLCQRIIVMNYGEKIAEGTPKEVQHNEEVIKAYLGDEHEFA